MSKKEKQKDDKTFSILIFETRERILRVTGREGNRNKMQLSQQQEKCQETKPFFKTFAIFYMAVYRPPFPSLLSYSLTVNKNPPFFFLSLDAPSFHFLIFDPCVVAILSILPDIFKLYFLPSASHDAAQIEVASCSRLLFGFLKNKKTFSDVPYL